NDLQQLVLAERFDGLAEMTLQLSGGQLLAAVAVSAGSAVSGSEKGVELELEREESFATVSLNTADDAPDPGVVGIVLDSSRKGNIIFCYRGDSADGHEPPQCTGRKLDQGQNKLFFRVLKQFKNGTLEIRPALPGRYRLDSIAVRTETL
ncbi:MAG: hypothetical protein V2I35_05790, partial [Desulfocapsaceae bacterium]|nr:hypothetical protein [Desulfocapsaceae bacterium]